MKIVCDIITGHIKDLAKQIGRSESFTCNLVSVWKTQNNSSEYPTASQLNDLLHENKEKAWDIYLAIPNYEVREYDPNIVPIEHSNGNIYLMKLPKNNPMEHFYNMYKHLPELKELAVTPEEAYRFILWREMAFMQYGLDKKVENRPVAEGEAIKKTKEWRKRHPVKVLSGISQATQLNESDRVNSILGPETKINIYAGTNENADLSNFAERPFVLTGALAERLEKLVGFPVFADKYYPDEGEEVKNKNTYNSVEQAFQIAKIGFAFDGTDEAIDNLTAEKIEHSIKESTSSGAKRLGRTIPMSKLAISNWDKFSSQIMKELIKASFEQNPQALQRLLATGNATLTHAQDKGKWGKEFPKLLMEVREELRQESGLTAPQVQPIIQQRVAKSFSVEEAAATPAPQIVTQEDTENVYKVPEIGSEVLRVDPNNPVARLTNDFTPFERHDRVEMLARSFSTIVDKAVKEKITEIQNTIKEELGSPNKDVNELSRLYEKLALFNDSTLGRRAVIKEKTVQQIFKEMKSDIESYTQMSVEELDADYGKGKGQYIIDSYQRVLDNWYMLLTEACNLLEGRENVRIVIDTHDYNNGTSVENVIDGNISDSTQDEDNRNAQLDDDVEGRRVDGNGGWSYKVRFLDPLTTMSMRTRSLLYSLKDVNADGSPKVDDLGYIRYVNGEYAHAALINHLSGMMDADDFSIENEDGTYRFPALEKIAERNSYPWVTQVINALQADHDLISAFYADFRKDFIPYWMQYYDENKGSWVTHQMNRPVALTSTLNNIINNYEQGTVLEDDSIYGKGRKINQGKAKVGIELTNEVLFLLREFDSDDYDRIVSKTSKAVRMVGLESNPSMIGNLLKSEEGINSLEKVVNSLKNIFNGIESMPETAHLVSTFSSDFNIIAREIGLVSELDNVQSFRNGDQTYYSYSAPNYLNTMFKIFKDNKRRPDYLQSQFGKYSWFKDEKNGKWRSEWLNLIEKDADVRNHIDLQELININGVEYTNWTPIDIKNAFIRAYFSAGYNPGSKKQYAWYNIPIFSDSPVTMMIKFLRYTGDDFKNKILPLLNQVVKQELSRIKLVQNRKSQGAKEIVNFDKNGNKFNFFPELNANDNAFLKEALELTDRDDLDGLNTLINNALIEIMDNNFNRFLSNYFTEESFEDLRSTLLSEGVITSESQFRDALEEYFWNQAYATTQIIQLTTTDLAYYKDEIDFQKRYKEVYAAGTKLNTNSKYGRKTERALYLKDQITTSSGYTDIRRVLNTAVKEGRIKSFDRDNILNKFKKIDVTDAQAYRSISSMRAVLDMIGAWTPEMQQAMNKFDPNNEEGGTWTMADFNIVWQTIKPFVFTQIEKPDGLGGVIKVPHQNKNSEFLLLAMHSMLGGSLSKSSKLKALNKFMENNDIDVIQFETAVKVGKEGIIDISYSEKKLNAWKKNNSEVVELIDTAAKTVLGSKYDSYSEIEKFKAGNDYLLDNDMITQEAYNERFEYIEPNEQEVYDILQENSMSNGVFKPEVLHEIPYSDYMIQQPTPEHLFDSIAVFGSQYRNLIVSDMPDSPNFRVTINGKEYTKKQVLDLYNSLIVENLLEDWEQAKGKFANIRTLQKALLNSIKGNPKYGRDMTDALQIVKITNPINGEEEEVFNIPLDNPSTTLKIQELVTAVFRNLITNQKIKGASCILVSDFGLTKELQIIYGEDKSIQGIECYLPAYSKQFYQPFLKTSNDGKYEYLDIDKMPMDLRRIIGYRIPTEDKYSMAPLIIKGFLPQQNGSSIMLPADITTIAGSDFDVDKMFLMIPEFQVIKYNKRKAREDYAKINEVFSRALSMFTNSKLAEDILSVDNEEGFKDWYEKNKSKYEYEIPKVIKVKYDASKSPQEQSGSPIIQRMKRNNMIIDISWGILTHPDTAKKILNPGNFDKAKIAARISKIITTPSLLNAFARKYKLISDGNLMLKGIGQKLLKMSEEGNLEELDNFISDHREERSQLTVDTFIYNHVQNMTGAALIGMYAINTSMQAKYQNTNLSIKDDYVFTINGRKIKSLHDIYSSTGERISKNCANFSAASVDNVKDPVLADLMQNMNTANITGFMLRAGMSIEEVGLLFSQPVVRKCIMNTGSLEALSEYVKNMITTLTQNGGGFDANIQIHDFTSEELIMNILNSTRDTSTLSTEESNNILASQIQAALLMNHIVTIANDVTGLSRISRADSPNASMDISIAGAKLQVQKVNLYTRQSKLDKFTLAGVEDALKNDYITSDMSIDDMREKLLKSKVPMLQAFYSLGVELPTSIISNYFSQASEYSDRMVEYLFDNSGQGVVSKRILNNFYNELIEFALSRTEIFGNDEKSTFDEKRDYYLYDFPKDYIFTLGNNPDIAKLNVFKKLRVKDGQIVMQNSGRLTPMMRETLMRDFDSLLYMSPESQKLAVDLFAYSYYKDGFKFGPNSFGTFFSSNFISAFPEVVKTLRELKYNVKSGTYFDNYLSQFYANHWNEGIVPKIPNDADVIEGKGSIAVTSRVALNRNLLGKNIVKSYPLVIYKNQLYNLTSDGNDRAVYTLSPILNSNQKGIRGVKYNANMSIQEMSDIYTNEDKIKANKELNPSQDRGMSFGDELFKSLEELENNELLTGLDNYFNAVENSSNEDYDPSVGAAQIDNELC